MMRQSNMGVWDVDLCIQAGTHAAHVLPIPSPVVFVHHRAQSRTHMHEGASMACLSREKEVCIGNVQVGPRPEQHIRAGPSEQFPQRWHSLWAKSRRSGGHLSHWRTLAHFASLAIVQHSTAMPKRGSLCYYKVVCLLGEGAHWCKVRRSRLTTERGKRGGG
ncbi:hypothetical protein DL89DRAFT_52236 [Linderina pennispora]|uniref:Uncharacterized protein n=1 Tax=Linderina pennispora TaxID=61395 RepID=A0A1Y1W0S5_9FUNG|nr:uncharacterized protein DL89DRAFT_52236 [Linderina pennispora]ORX67107.1 hypothetical protein DL89DRAFT_52236 [Linderina pennispora]